VAKRFTRLSECDRSLLRPNAHRVKEPNIGNDTPRGHKSHKVLCERLLTGIPVRIHEHLRRDGRRGRGRGDLDHSEVGSHIFRRYLHAYLVVLNRNRVNWNTELKHAFLELKNAHEVKDEKCTNTLPYCYCNKPKRQGDSVCSLTR
jgi:hypothetical protein